MKKMCIYIHIPYCKKRCLYCSFFSSQPPQNNIEEYVNALKKEITAAKTDEYAITSIYFGGGTPSYIPGKYIKEILQTVRDNYKVQKTAEISLEANPETVTSEKAKIFKQSGINRVSMGLQTANDSILKTLGRSHTKIDFINAVDIVRKHGINNISADIMLGLPGQREKDIIETLNLLKNLQILHISAYGLKVEEGTELYKKVNSKELSLPSDNEGAVFYDIVQAELEKRQIYRYEVSNFAAEGYQCRHNLSYWQRRDYLGFGVSAHSFFNGERFENISDIKGYIERGGLNCKINKTVISPEEAEFEYIMLRLRLSEGINFNHYKKLFKEDFQKKYSNSIKKLKDYLVVQDGNINVSKKGFNVLNLILVNFVP